MTTTTVTMMRSTEARGQQKENDFQGDCALEDLESKLDSVKVTSTYALIARGAQWCSGGNGQFSIPAANSLFPALPYTAVV